MNVLENEIPDRTKMLSSVVVSSKGEEFMLLIFQEVGVSGLSEQLPHCFFFS